MMPQTTSFSSPQNSRNPLVIALIVVLAVGTVGFGIVAVVGFSKANTATTTLQAQRQAAADSARADQKKVDQAATELASESPFRSYVAPVEYGSFEIKFPKNWSGYVSEARADTVQVSLIINPDFVKQQDSVDDLSAAKITLNQQTLKEYTDQYTTNPDLQKSDTTVSGIPAVQFTGKFSDERTKRLIAVPIRDKTLVFTNENPAYDSEFNIILAQSKINP
jgi:hypothetical protein